MSWMPDPDPTTTTENCPEQVELAIIPRTGDIGNYEVRRALPYKTRRMVGPFIFWDQMGPGEFLAGQGIDVRPHPHIGLSTVTYLFAGSIDHRDSLGTFQTITPGAVNLMQAGSGIVHSERTGPEVRQQASRLAGIQSWLAQPKSHENNTPAFVHYSKETLPELREDGLHLRLIAGHLHGLTSPVKTDWDTLYADIHLGSGQAFDIPKETEERALYILTGRLTVGGVTYDGPQMLVLKPGKPVTITAQAACHLMLLGGATMDGPRFIWWNFVASSKERLEQAKEDWRQQRFAKVPGDEKEFIPLPEAMV